MTVQVRVELEQLIQHDQRLGSDDDFMMSTVRFELYVDGLTHGHHEVAIKQAAGSGPEDLIEVLPFAGYRGPIDYEAFRAGIEAYYRSLIGSSGMGIRVGPGARNIRMVDNTFIQPAHFEFTVASGASGAW